MKKKLALTILSLACAFCLAFGFAGCDLFGGGMLNKSKLTLKIGESYQLTAKTESEVAWKSDDTSVVRVNNAGKVTALEEGSAEITATAKDGKSAICAVTVKGLVESGVAGMTFVFENVACDGDYPDLEKVKASMEGTEVVFDQEGNGASYSLIEGTYVLRGNRIVFTPGNAQGSMVFEIMKNRLMLTLEDKEAVVSVIYQVKIELPEEEDPGEDPGQDKPGQDQPSTDGIVGKTFIFEDATSEDYPYLESWKSGMQGQEMTFNADGTVVAKAGSMRLSGTYTVEGDTITVTANGRDTTYTIKNGKITYDTKLNLQGTTYTITSVFRLKTEDDEPYFEELAGKTFKFESVTSTTLDGNLVNTLKNSYKNATITFSADGTYTLFIPGDSLDTDPNAYARQDGTFTCRNGEGRLTVTSMVSGGESVEVVPGATVYSIALNGNTLTLRGGEVIFTYILVTE